MPPTAPSRLAPFLALGSLLAVSSAGCLIQHHANTNPLSAVQSAQPDKVLFDIAMADLDKNKYTVSRLNLETLLNTYPDSEYLARAKMAIADSWYREGGVEGMAQAEAQYRDFITFFPAMKEASEAQLKIATIHYNQIQKPDRDPTQALRAQAELRTFLLSYPDSPLRKQAVQMLRDSQEVLAEREYRIGDFYLERAKQGEFADYRAAQSRLEQLLATYPLYSQGDVALDQLANSYATTSKLYAGAAGLEGNPQMTKSLYEANADADHAKAVQDFSRLVDRYPLSPLDKDADQKLAAMHVPAPKPSEEAIAFNRQEIAGRQTVPHPHGVTSAFGLGSMLSGRPSEELARADKVGEPALAQPQLAESEPPPGLDALIKQTMIATGALPNAQIGTALIGTGGTAGGNPAATTPASATGGTAAATTTAAKPLAFQDVTTKPQGADTPQSSTPQSVTGNNDNDPNARRAAAVVNPSVLLTPNELDLQNREQMLAAEIHRDVPAPASELRKTAQQQQQARAKLLAKIKQAGGVPPAAQNPKTPPPDAPPAVPKKKSLFHIW
ncbi:MAG: outer membrane protein assembly factor BamD [Terriglobales bacterium]